jgi:hypothetical protein
MKTQRLVTSMEYPGNVGITEHDQTSIVKRLIGVHSIVWCWEVDHIFLFFLDFPLMMETTIHVLIKRMKLIS